MHQRIEQAAVVQQTAKGRQLAGVYMLLRHHVQVVGDLRGAPEPVGPEVFLLDHQAPEVTQPRPGSKEAAVSSASRICQPSASDSVLGLS